MMNRLPLTDSDAVDRLGADCARAGYSATGVPALLGVGAHHALGRGQPWPALAVTRRAADAGSAVALLTRLFLLGTTEWADDAQAALPTLGVDDAVAAGALECVPAGAGGRERVRAALDIRPYADDAHSFLVVSDLDTDTRTGPLRPDHVLGIGAASLTLARAVIRRPVEAVLDLGTGCGIQALHCSAHARTVTATDTNPRALALAAATARLNGLHWDLRRGSLFDPVGNERFDLIVSNPPFVVSAGHRNFAYRDSGLAGDELCRTLVSQVHDHLRPGGTAQVLANWAIRGDGDWRAPVSTWVASSGCDGWVVQREVAEPAEYVSLWLADTGEDTADDAAARAGEWMDYFAAENITGIGMGTITLRKPAMARAGTPDIVFDSLPAPGEELSGGEVDAFLARRAWLSDHDDDGLLAARLSLSADDLLEQRSLPGPRGWSPVLHVLHRPGGPGARVQLDDWGVALLAGCTGDVPLATQIDVLAAAHGIDAAALAEAVLPTVRTAVTRGLLHPVEAAGGR